MKSRTASRKPRSDTKLEIPKGPRRRRGKPLVEGFSAVSEIDVHASAGPGAINDGLEESKETWLFPDPVIRHEFRANPRRVTGSTVSGRFANRRQRRRISQTPAADKTGCIMATSFPSVRAASRANGRRNRCRRAPS